MAQAVIVGVFLDLTFLASSPHFQFLVSLSVVIDVFFVSLAIVTVYTQCQQRLEKTYTANT